ncbi:MAG TPA: VOC family protein [Chitinophagales bacterium]|nr:VOC family protein [Chitinophagales bacterium]
MAAVKPIPDGYHTVTPYLVVKGANNLITFLKQAFDAKEITRMDRENGDIMHSEMSIGDSRVMLSDASDQFPPTYVNIFLYVPDTDVTYKKAISAGCTSLMEPVDQFYGDRMGGVKDQFGNQWWIGTHVEDVSPEEMKRRQEAMGQQQQQSN